MKELEKNDHYQVLKVELPAGTQMPRHFATSAAFVIVESGNALLICKGETSELSKGSTCSIPSHEPHILKVIQDFKALIIMAGNAVITYPVL
ncbi:cupin domain-containing protein [Mucilaginibacter mali]|jgi:quercetin dioxygenase-like cupin family protein|uniref:Cupin domain-containing protein n=1 Tax=Mucilaginibacter mali TaxID=2740462 RepID=A0A7D4TSD6_9SPHI|nr:cupin domain-containing protein [Mucilaginibacter mali]QKJ28215.1 cupin domain-containing protein [Mucilaginibacter mali]